MEEGDSYRLYMSLTMSISASAWAIFCSLEIWGRPPMPKKDILNVYVRRYRGIRSRRESVSDCGVGGCDIAAAVVAFGCRKAMMSRELWNF
jgi:hypothetical protein